MEIDRACTKCTSKSCIKWFGGTQVSALPVSHFVCEYELVSYSVRTKDEPTLVAGVFNRELTLVQDKARRARLAKTRTVTPEVLLEWARKCERAIDDYDNLVRAEVEAAVAPLHDLKAAVGLLQRNVERIVQRYPGDTFEEKIDRAGDQDVVRLLKTASVLTTRLELTSIVNNPSSASYGRKRPGQVYRIFHKFVRLFEPMAQDRSIKIEMTGASYAETQVYDSFETIPLLLIDNAIKYSEGGTTITVTVNDRPADIAARVSSYGKVVPVSERTGIFDRGVRGGNANRAGTGLGLYIASTVASAHGSSISYGVEAERDGWGWNQFNVVLPRAARR